MKKLNLKPRMLESLFSRGSLCRIELKQLCNKILKFVTSFSPIRFSKRNRTTSIFISSNLCRSIGSCQFVQQYSSCPNIYLLITIGFLENKFQLQRYLLLLFQGPYKQQIQQAFPCRNCLFEDQGIEPNQNRIISPRDYSQNYTTLLLGVLLPHKSHKDNFLA